MLGKHTEMRPYTVDVHLNVTGGLEMSEPATDLAGGWHQLVAGACLGHCCLVAVGMCRSS